MHFLVKSNSSFYSSCVHFGCSLNQSMTVKGRRSFLKKHNIIYVQKKLNILKKYFKNDNCYDLRVHPIPFENVRGE